jgi:hypothetical protein
MITITATTKMTAIKIPNSDGFLWNGPSITGFFSTLRGKVLVV